MRNNMSRTLWQLPVVVGFAALAFLVFAPKGAQAQELFACYVPSSGVVYRVNGPDSPGDNPDLKDACLGKHVLFNWNVEAPSGGAGLTVSGGQVFNGTTPTTWTDLDLSSIVGTNAAFVSLMVTNNGAAEPTFNTIVFRQNGDSHDFRPDIAPSGSNRVSLTNATGFSAMVTIHTDNHGTVEWKALFARDGVTVDVVMYIN